MHSFDEYTALTRDAASMAPHNNEIGSARLFGASIPVSAPCDGWYTFAKFCAALGKACSACLMSSRLPLTAVEIDASLSVAIPAASRLSLTNWVASATTELRSSMAAPTAPG